MTTNLVAHEIAIGHFAAIGQYIPMCHVIASLPRSAGSCGRPLVQVQLVVQEVSLLPYPGVVATVCG